MPASRRVTRAVSAVLDLAPRRGEVSLPRLVEAVADDQGRPIQIKMADLPSGVCGQWRQYTDYDVFLIQKGLPAWTGPWHTSSVTWCSATTGPQWSRPPARPWSWPGRI